MESIDKRRLMLQLRQVESARMELEIRIDEMLAEIERIRGHIAVQEAKETELKAKIAS